MSQSTSIDPQAIDAVIRKYCGDSNLVIRAGELRAILRELLGEQVPKDHPATLATSEGKTGREKE